MERTITQDEVDEDNISIEIIYDSHAEPIIISKYLMDIFLKEEKDFEHLLALFAFYYYTAKWQGTDTPRATDTYCCNGLHWQMDKLKRIKLRLKQLNLIKVIQKKDEASGKFLKAFVHLNFYFNQSRETVDGKTYYGDEKPLVGFYGQRENPTTNALRTLSLNALRTNKEEECSPIKNSSDNSIRKKGKKDKRIEMFLPVAKKLSDIIKKNKNITTTTKQLTSWASSIGLLMDENKVSPERIDNVLDWYGKHIGGQFIPVVESGNSFRTKFVRLETAMKNNGYPDRTKVNKPKMLIRYGEEYHYNSERDEYYNKQGERLR